MLYGSVCSVTGSSGRFKIMKVVKKEKEARFSGCNADVSV